MRDSLKIILIITVFKIISLRDLIITHYQWWSMDPPKNSNQIKNKLPRGNKNPIWTSHKISMGKIYNLDFNKCLLIGRFIHHNRNKKAITTFWMVIHKLTNVTTRTQTANFTVPVWNKQDLRVYLWMEMMPINFSQINLNNCKSIEVTIGITSALSVRMRRLNGFLSIMGYLFVFNVLAPIEALECKYHS